jgi:hypothetical protein
VGSSGIYKIGGAGRTNATPNLDSGKIFLGNGSNQAVSTALSAINLSSFNDDLATNIVDDATPQLGGNLDVNGNDLISVSNGAINLAPDGTGKVTIKGNATGGSGQIVLNCEQNSHGITLKGPPHSSAATYTLTLPNNTGNNADVLQTDGSGNLSWTAQSGGGSSPAVTSASPGANYTISTYTGIEEIYLLTPSANISVFLPAAATCGSGYKYNIKNLSANTITLDPNSSETIDGSTTFNLSIQYESVTLVTDGLNWFIV